MINIRLDLIFAINKLSQFYYNLIIRYVNAVNRILKYVVKIIIFNLYF